MRDISSFLGNNWPDVGKHICTCTDVKKAESKQKKTPSVRIEWTTVNGDVFTDDIFVVPKAIKRLALVAIRVCEWDKTQQLPDNESEAMTVLANFIFRTIKWKRSLVTIEQINEEYVVEQGPDIGQRKTRTKKKVSFNGYEPVTTEDKQVAPETEDGLPF